MRVFNLTSGQVMLKFADGRKVPVNPGQFSVNLTPSEVSALRSQIQLQREAGRLLEEDADGDKILKLIESQKAELDQQDNDQGITDTTYGTLKGNL